MNAHLVRRRSIRASLRRPSAVLAFAALVVVGLCLPPVQAVNGDQGTPVVSANPADFTPQ